MDPAVFPQIGLTPDVSAALQGTEGDPSDLNRYVTDEDPRLAGGVGLPIAESDVTGLVADLAALTSDVDARLEKALNLSDLASAATARTNLGLGSLATLSTVDAAHVAADVATQAELDAVAASAYDPGAFHYLDYDTTGATNGVPALRAAYDAGVRNFVFKKGTFLWDSAFFDDDEDGMSQVFIYAAGCTIIPGPNLPSCSEFNTFTTNKSLPTATKICYFSSTYPAALSGGVVTTVGHHVLGTATHGATKSGIHPRLVVHGGHFNATDRTGYNAAFCHTNLGGATEFNSFHMINARALLITGSQYVDGNKMDNCSAWTNDTDSTKDMSLFYQYGNGDGVRQTGSKTAGPIWLYKGYSCNGGVFDAPIGGAYFLQECHGISIRATHIESAPNIQFPPARYAIYCRDSHFTMTGGWDYLSAVPTQGSIYLDDSLDEGKFSNISVTGWYPRVFQDPSSNDPQTGMALYINKMQNKTKLHFHDCYAFVTASDSTFGQAAGPMGLPIGGNATNEPSLAAGVAAGLDHIGSGNFMIGKETSAAAVTGQNVAANIRIRGIGNMSRGYYATRHSTPILFDNEAYGATGTLTNGQAYEYMVALCNSLPDGTLAYGQKSVAQARTAGVLRKIIQEVRMPTGTTGGTLVIWRKAGTGVDTAPDVWVKMPVGHNETRIFDTGANINGLPWQSSPPAPSTVAASNHTGDGTSKDALYLNGDIISTGGGVTLPIAESDVTNLTTDLAAKLVKASNLSDLASAATARTNLGLGTAAVAAATDFAPATGIAESAITGLVADLAAKAPLASPALTGNPTTPDQADGDNDASIANTKFVQRAITLLGLGTAATHPASDFEIAGAAAAEAATRAAADALLAPKASPTFTGTVTLPEGDDAAAGVASRRTLGTGAQQAAAGDDSRLTNARTPTSHASTHATGGSDPVTIDESQVTNLVADLAGKAPAAGSVGGAARIIRRTADTATRATTTTLVVDDASGGTLAFPIAANEIWSFIAVLAVASNGGAGDFKCGWTFPTGATMQWGALGAQANNVAGFGPVPTTATPLVLVAESGSLSVGTVNGTIGVNLQGWVVNSSTAGTVTLTWAQVASSAETIRIKANSHIILWRIA